MSKKEFTTLGKNIFEFRYDPIISFYDWKGALAEHLINELKFDGFRISNNRIDLANPDKLDFSMFVSIQNAGFVIENNTDVEIFKSKISSFLQALKKFNKFTPKKIVRMGVRWNFLKHKKNISFAQIKKSFEENIVQLNKTPYNKFEENLVDIGLPLNFRGEKLSYNIMHGPMEQNQAIGMFFINREIYLDRYGNPSDIVPKHGFFFDVDVFKENLGEMTLDNLEIKAKEFTGVGNEKFNTISDELFNKVQ